MSVTPLDEKNVELVQNEATVTTAIDLGVTTDINPDGLRKSAFDELRIWDAVKIFRVAVFYCFMCYTMSMLDGWSVGQAVSLSG